jgi:hypothetical protein
MDLSTARSSTSTARRPGRGAWSQPYYSRGRFTPVRSGAGPFVWTIPSGTQVTLFSYAVSADMGPAGRSTVTASYADTNIQTAGQTIGGQVLEIKRLSLQLNPNSEPALAKLAWPEITVRLSLDGGLNGINLGTPAMLPGGGGLYGQATSLTAPQPLGGGRPELGVLSNGWPVESNMCPVPEGIFWQGTGRDSNLAVIVKVERDIVLTGQLADEVAAAGIRGYNNPAAQALQAASAPVFLDFMVMLKGEATAGLSVNA